MKIITTIILVFISIFSVLGQNYRPLKNYPTPNATSMNVYGQIPVDYYTGQPNISIPIYELNEGNIGIQISLNYQLASIKPNKYNGWTGLGWNLNAGGVITRKVNGFFDEMKKVGDERNKTEEHGYGFYWNHKQLGANLKSKNGIVSWPDKGLVHYYNAVINAMFLNETYEILADEFSFNFSGYTGTFFMDKEGNWVVVSDDAIKVEFDPDTGFSSFEKMEKEKKDYLYVEQNYESETDNREIALNCGDYTSKSVSSHYFNVFTLITPDGTRYTFGGKYAVEYSIPFFKRDKGYFVPTSWHLTKIESTDGRCILLEYIPGSPICEIKPMFNQTSSNFNCNYYSEGQGINRYPSNNGCLQNFAMSGHLMYPVYLKTIKSSLGEINFISSNSNIVAPHETLLFLRPNAYNPGSDNFSIYDGGFYQDKQALWNGNFFLHQEKGRRQFKWKMLNKIEVRNTDRCLKEFHFYYDEYPYRFNLTKLREVPPGTAYLDKDSNEELSPGNEYDGTSQDLNASESTIHNNLIEYCFRYNKNRFPEYGVQQEDHWGYYNNSTYSDNQSVSSKNPQQIDFGIYENRYVEENQSPYYQYRNINMLETDHIFAETLEKITYPTGGYTLFKYEPHMYKKVVLQEKDKELKEEIVVKQAGGLRIKQVASYDKLDNIISSKNYYYTSNLMTLDNRNSTGILAYEPTYRSYYSFDMNEDVSVKDNLLLGYKPYVGNINAVEASSGGVSPQSINGENRYITYTSVIESQTDKSGNANGYTKYTFTNYEKDIWGNTHFDEPPFYFSSEYKSDRMYKQYKTSNKNERGKLISLERFNSDKKQVEKILYKYDKVGGKKYEAIHYESQYICTDAFLSLGATYNINTYSYLPIEEIKTTYNENGEELTTDIKKFTYNSRKILRTEMQTVKKGINTEEHTIERRYADDIDEEKYEEMVKKNVVNKPIEIIHKVNNYITNATINTYMISYTKEIPLLEKVYKLQLKEPIASSLFTYFNGNKMNDKYKLEVSINKYDIHNNICEIQDKNGLITSYLWGYKGVYPVAEIRNIPYSTVEFSLKRSVISSLITDTEVDIYSINKLRQQFKNALITTYTYIPLVGKASESDYNGLTTYYKYNELGNLSEKYIIENGHKKILESYYYNFLNK